MTRRVRETSRNFRKTGAAPSGCAGGVGLSTRWLHQIVKARRPARLMRAGYSNYPAMHQA